MRLEGRICCLCKSSVPAPHIPGERLCDRCTAERSPKRKIYLQFMLNKHWQCQFLEEDLKTSLHREVSFSDAAKLFTMAERGGYRMNLEGRQAIEHAIEKGRGGIWLHLNEDQYARLKRR